MVTRKFPRPLKTKQKGIDILHDPLWNKGMGFDETERDRLNLRGLLPPRVKTIADQERRAIAQIRKQPDDVTKNMYLQELHNRNETLYHGILVKYIEELAPIVYTPTVGVVCEEFGSQFRRARGMYFSRNDRGHFAQMVHNWPHDSVHIIVVTDGSRILGLGDLGAYGMGIPIGKLALYCAAGGLAPHRVLPVVLDVGTNNDKLLNDPDYIGVAQKRLDNDEYYDMIDEFMEAVFDRWPGCVVQFEDFETSKAIPLLAKYRHRYRCFNDDIQGTGCVTLAGIISSAKQAGVKLTDLSFMCAGAGSAGLGVCKQIVDGMVEAGLSREEAMSRFVICTSIGALGKADGTYGDPNLKRGINEERLEWVNPVVPDGMPMEEVVKTFKPMCLLGLAAQDGGLFTEKMVSSMLDYCDRPMVMPMSNPTAKHECTPAQAYEWTKGKAVVATGSPFDPVTLPDGKVMVPSQCNNMYVFPGIGLAASVAGVKEITDKMLYKAAVACAESMTEAEKAEGRTFPSIKRIRDVSHAVACAVIQEALDSGLTTKFTRLNMSPEEIQDLVARKMYNPTYSPLVDSS
eukprot:CAMPEP_0181315390 /NCGR_PEP_ID=MMETSP1101-20121128/15350_1 /TAXON_ID=46948 /ORGANISM="Rhodomonas abbreviata, Strain Caron Lab Isolate" /LENGTH=571 /DNA_ID=CAMNT_0023422595 /DNA_START=161 /DNA_END=1876 /DNA_ORIENTATION=-